MLNNLTNFLNLISTKMMKNTPEGSDLIILGTRDHKYGGGYKPTGISVDDFVNSIPTGGVQSVTGMIVDNTDPVNPVVDLNVDGETITGAGTIGDPLVAPYQAPTVDGVTITGTGAPGDPLTAVSSGGSLNWSNVAFVDAVNGNDGTAAVGDASKPYLSLQTAMNAISALTPSVSAPGLVYVRQGTYTSIYTFRNYVYVYCEPGVVFRGGFIDDVNSGTCKLLGYAKFYNTTTPIYLIAYSTNLYFEFDEVYNYGTGQRCIYASVEAAYQANIVMSCNKYYSSSLAYDGTFRGNVNVTLNIKVEYKAAYSIYNRSTTGGTVFNGTFTINCPSIILEDGGPSGNNATYKRILRLEGLGASSKTIVNGSLIDQCNAYYGGTHSLVYTVSNSLGAYIELNGNQKAGKSAGIYITDGTYIRLNGDISGEIYTIILASSGILDFTGGKITKLSNASYINATISVGLTSTLFLRNAAIENKETNADVIVVGGSSAKLYAYNCQIKGVGTGYCISGGGYAPSVGLINVRSNLNKDAAVTEAYTPAGLTVDTALVVPTF